MIRQFAERFSAHEVPAPHGAWEAISSQLTLSAAASADGVNELFRDRFAEHAMDASPSVWNNVSGQLGHGAAGGWGAVAAWAGAGIAALVLTGTLVWVTREEPIPTAEQASVPVITQEPTQAPPSMHVQEPTVKGVESHQAAVHSQPATVAHHTPPLGTGSGDIAAIQQEMQEKASEQPLMPVESITDPRLAEEHRPILAPPVEVSDPHVAELKPNTASNADTHDNHSATEDNGTSTAPPSEVVPEPLGAKPFSLYLPNVFTPNGDGVNDQYLPEGEVHVDMKIRVYSMTNNQQLVYSAEEKRGWDGTYFNGGQACPEGMYLVAVEVVDVNGKAHAEGQVVNLLR